MKEPIDLTLEQQANQHATSILPHLTQSHIPAHLIRLRDLLTQLEAVYTQEAVLNMVRLQEQGGTDDWYGSVGYKNAVLNFALWRGVRARGYDLMREFLTTTVTAYGAMEKEYSVFPSSLSLRTDFDPVRQLYLIFPAEVVGEGCDYSFLSDFYVRLLRAVPADIEVILFAKTRVIADHIRSQVLHAQLKIVVHSELESIWLRDYAGFNQGVRLVKPRFSPKRIGDTMKLLHSLAELDLAPLDLVWDGGNLVTNGSLGFISTRIFKHNPKKSPTEIRELVRSELGISPVWVELPKSDRLAHTDGYMTFISPTRALVSTYPSEWTRLYPADQRCVDALSQQLESLGIVVERILEYPYPLPGKSSVDSAVGTYVNLLQLNKTWLVPVYGHPAEEQLLAQLQRLNPEGLVVPLECTELAELGGVLHCISFCN